jgi:hypothetical protein
MIEEFEDKILASVPRIFEETSPRNSGNSSDYFREVVHAVLGNFLGNLREPPGTNHGTLGFL